MIEIANKQDKILTQCSNCGEMHYEGKTISCNCLRETIFVCWFCLEHEKYISVK